MIKILPQIKSPKAVCLSSIKFLLIGMLFGAIQDQITFFLSKAYYEEHKFLQFGYLGFIENEFVLVSVIGMIASGIPSLVIGYFLKNYGKSKILQTNDVKIITSLIGYVLIFEFIGFTLATIYTNHLNQKWFMGWEHVISPNEITNFIMVGVMHNFAYLGAIWAVIKLLKQK